MSLSLSLFADTILDTLSVLRESLAERLTAAQDEVPGREPGSEIHHEVSTSLRERLESLRYAQTMLNEASRRIEQASGTLFNIRE